MDLQDDPLRTVVAVVLFLVLAPDDGKGVHDVRDGVAGLGKALLHPGQVLGKVVVRTAVGPPGRDPVHCCISPEIG